MVGRLVSLWDGFLAGATSVSGRVYTRTDIGGQSCWMVTKLKSASEQSFCHRHSKSQKWWGSWYFCIQGSWALPFICHDCILILAGNSHPNPSLMIHNFSKKKKRHVMSHEIRFCPGHNQKSRILHHVKHSNTIDQVRLGRGNDEVKYQLDFLYMEISQLEYEKHIFIFDRILYQLLWSGSHLCKNPATCLTSIKQKKSPHSFEAACQKTKHDEIKLTLGRRNADGQRLTWSTLSEWFVLPELNLTLLDHTDFFL